MSNKWLIIGVWSWLLGVLLSSIMSSDFVGGTQKKVLDQLQLFTVVHVGKFPVPLINTNFFDGVLAVMDPKSFLFLQGSIILWIIYLFNIGLAFGLMVIFATLLWGFFRR